MNRPPVIGFVCTTQENLEHVRELTHKKGCRLVFIQSGLEDSLEPAKRMIKADGVEVILSRRGTAHMLREHVDVPVLSLPETVESLYRAVKQALFIGPRIAITLFRNTNPNLTFCEELLGTTLHPIYYSSKKTMESGIIAAIEQGIDVVIGGGVTQRAAAKHGLPFVSLHDNSEVDDSLFDNIINIVYTKRRETLRNERYMAIINGVSDGIIAVDAAGNINEVNGRVSQILKVEEADLMGAPLQSILPDPELLLAALSGRKIARTAVARTGEHLLVNGLPVRTTRGDNAPFGAVYTLQPASQVFLAEERVRASFRKNFSARYRLSNFLHQEAQTAAMLARIERYAATASTLLISGESGTGKEIVAQGVHNASPRRTGPFVSINCSAMPKELLESELFGYAEGAFTGSRRGGKIGLFELAQGGTVFLDEIGTIPLHFQSRLLRVLQEKEIMRIGSNSTVSLDVRILAASNRDLEQEVRSGRLREDLFFRLNVLSISIPPLRERRGDIAPILHHFLREAAQRNKIPVLTVPESCLAKLRSLTWPGNVRQLQSFTEQLAVLSGKRFDREVFAWLVDALEQSSANIAARPSQPKAAPMRPGASRLPALPERPEMAGMAGPEPGDTRKKKIGPDELQAALAQAGNAKGLAARILGISRSTLWRLLQEYPEV